MRAQQHPSQQKRKSRVISDSLKQDASGIVRGGGAPLFRVEHAPEGVLVSFLDKRDDRRVQARGGQECVYLSAEQLAQFLSDLLGATSADT